VSRLQAASRANDGVFLQRAGFKDKRWTIPGGNYGDWALVPTRATCVFNQKHLRVHGVFACGHWLLNETQVINTFSLTIVTNITIIIIIVCN
jgi:hypothetical protein